MNATAPTVAYVGGAMTVAYLVAGLFFLKFWARTRETLFAVFAVAFWLLAANHAAPVLMGIPSEEQSGVYLLRLAAFLLIIIAILRKNMGGKPGA